MGSDQIKKPRQLAFWDIESLVNIFMFAIYAPKSEFFGDGSRDMLIFFYLFDGFTLTDSLKDRILKQVFRKNRQLDPATADIRFMDLKQEQTNRFLVGLFSVDDKRAFGRPDENRFLKINHIIRSDLDEDTSFPYLLGYNTANYDDIMMALYFTETWGFSPRGNVPSFDATTAAHMREMNNHMFSRYKNDMRGILREGPEKNIYENLLRTGLFVDVAKVNDKVYKMPLKRIMGMLGMDIFEDGSVSSDRPVTDPDEIANLFAYNASDDIKLSALFEHRAFKAQFELKRGLMDSYPDILYKKDDKTGREEIRINRMKCDDTSAKFAQRVLCPDGWLTDIRAVSFEYPKGSGRNVLVETREWAERQFGKDSEPMKLLGPIFDWYGAIEGHNFDSSEHYEQAYLFDGLDPIKIASIPQPQTAVPYFNKDGTPSRTYVNFGIGGIHGAEYDKDAYDADVAAFNARIAEIKAFLSNFTEDQLKTLKPTVVIGGVKYKRSDYLTVTKDGTVKVKWPKPVELFTQDKKSGKWNLNKKYSYTSDDTVEHEDFTSYYPCMLMNLQAYVNSALGEDRYVQQFENKGKYGKLMKDKSLPEEQRAFYATLREGTKLILNSASGASDTEYDNPIRMNNVIISMRLLGQMFTWRIGQAQTLAGFKITSTNTDGLYAAVTDETRQLCRDILAREAADINVDIEPESMRLVSKDANNRIEVSLDGNLLGASGGDVACWKGPVPNKALSHPALIDRLLVDYLIKYGVSEAFSLERAAEVLENVKKSLSPTDLLMLYQQIINSSEGSVRYIFGVVNGEVRTFQHNNRIFAIRPEGAHLYMANGWNKGIGHDETADRVLAAYGVDPMQFTNTRVMKISRIDPEQNMFIYNNALDELEPHVAAGLIASLDDGYYIEMFQRTYNNWSRVKSGAAPDSADEDGGMDE
ncbi:MAG: hypothetical protein NC311_12440 [Muribaculaceae bacterium]|nr:hypothetical protein [Muribaculaceae bacterium]